MSAHAGTSIKPRMERATCQHPTFFWSHVRMSPSPLNYFKNTALMNSGSVSTPSRYLAENPLPPGAQVLLPPCFRNPKQGHRIQASGEKPVALGEMVFWSPRTLTLLLLLGSDPLTHFSMKTKKRRKEPTFKCQLRRQAPGNEQLEMKRNEGATHTPAGFLVAEGAG